MDEIKSTGGPLICVESRLADQWKGIYGISVNYEPSIRWARPNFMWAGTDYGRACAIPNQYLCVLPLRQGAALILGDRPLITGVWKNSLDQVIIWRISYADADDDIPSLLAYLSEKSFEAPLESLEFSFESGNVLIFDTSLPGDDAPSESVSFDISPGRYLVTTHEVRPTPRAELSLHRFYPIT